MTLHLTDIEYDMFVVIGRFKASASAQVTAKHRTT